MSDHDEKQTVFLTGATGALGLAAVRTLCEAGHTVIGVTRSVEGKALLRSLGATPVEVDLFDRQALQKATAGATAVVHLATSIPAGMAAARRKNWAMNDRLRVEATRNLIAAAEANRVKRFIFESYFGAYPDGGEQWIDEGVALAPVVPFMRSLVEGEALVDDFGDHGGEAVNLRFGRLYGPGRASDAMAEMVRKRQMPIVGAGDNYVPSIHTDDAAAAILSALTAPSGTYNVSDDQPMRQSEHTRFISEALRAPAPRRLPRMLVRLMVGRLVDTLSISQRVSNRRFKEATGWQPRYPSAREGWAAMSPKEAETKTAVQMAGVS